MLHVQRARGRQHAVQQSSEKPSMTSHRPQSHAVVAHIASTASGGATTTVGWGEEGGVGVDGLEGRQAAHAHPDHVTAEVVVDKGSEVLWV